MTNIPSLNDIINRAIETPGLSDWAEARGIRNADDKEVGYEIRDRKTNRILGHVVAVNAPQAIKNWARDTDTTVGALYRKGLSLEARQAY